MEENYFMNYDATTGDILGFYLKSIHGDNIPTPNKEITPEKYDFYTQNTSKYRLNPITLEDEEITIDLDGVQQDKIAELHQSYNGALYTQFTSSADGTETVYDYSKDSETKFIKLGVWINLGQITYPYPIYDKVGTIHLLTQEQTSQLVQDLGTFEKSLQDKLHSYIDEVNSTTTVEQINSIVWS